MPGEGTVAVSCETHGEAVAGLLASQGHRPLVLGPDDVGSADHPCRAAVVGTWDGLDDPLGPCRAAARLRPTLLVADRPRFDRTLLARRTGAVAALPLPPSSQELADGLSRAMRRPIEPEHATRVLMVDDDEFVGEAVASALRSAGLDVRVENDPQGLLTAMDEFAPDVLLLDMRFPGMTGVELAGVVRMDRPETTVPVLFLSAERDAERRRAARREGADEFIPKGTPLPEIVEIVRARANATRRLRDAVSVDPVTGLRGTAAFRRCLSSAVAQGDPFTLAHMCVGGFEAFDGPSGGGADATLRAAARALRSGLRSDDVVGRQDGARFAAILSGTDPSRAMGAIGRVRSRLRQDTEGPAPVLSVGLAGWTGEGATTLSGRADAALARARTIGDAVVIEEDGR